MPVFYDGYFRPYITNANRQRLLQVNVLLSYRQAAFIYLNLLMFRYEVYRHSFFPATISHKAASLGIEEVETRIEVLFMSDITTGNSSVPLTADLNIQINRYTKSNKCTLFMHY